MKQTKRGVRGVKVNTEAYRLLLRVTRLKFTVRIRTSINLSPVVEYENSENSNPIVREGVTCNVIGR